jgi:hypothetical protein
MKSIALSDHPRGTSSFLTYTYLANIYSRISYLDLPLYGLLPNMSSYAITPRA